MKGSELERLRNAFVPIIFRAAGQYDADKVSFDSSIKEFDASKTVQSQAEEADINVIVRRFGITGELPIHQRVALVDDFTAGDVDYRTCLDYVRNADKAFADLPANVRSRFLNNPAMLIDFLGDDNNRDEAIKLGLIPEPKPAEPVSEPVKA